MAPLHDVSGEPLLGEAAKGLIPAKQEQFDAQVVLAEQLLGIAKTYTGSPFEPRIMTALSLQVNYQLGLGLDAFLHQQTLGTKGASAAYRGDEDGPPLIHPMAAELVRQVFLEEGSSQGGYETVQSVRGSVPGSSAFGTARLR